MRRTGWLEGLRGKLPLALAALSLAQLACGVSQQASKLPDGTWKVQCVDHVERCVRGAERVCGERDYEIVGGGRKTSVFGGATGEQTATVNHMLIVRCDPGSGAIASPTPPLDGESVPAVADQQVAAEPARAEPGSDAPEGRSRSEGAGAANERVCAPGTTQRCVGPGACSGGQSCKEDGSGYLPCDCGHAPAEPATSTAPAKPAPGEAPKAGSAP